MAVKYALFDNPLTPDPKDYMAMVQGQQSKTMGDIIARMIGRGSTVTKAEALGVMEEFEAAVSELLAEGHNVNTPLFKVGVSIKGVFNQEEEVYTPGKHTVRLNVTAGGRISQLSKGFTLTKVTALAREPMVLKFKDMETELVNATLTKGGVGEISGDRLKVDPDDPNQGIFLVGSNGTTTQVSKLIRNMPKNLIFMIPAGLDSGDYTLEVRKLFQKGGSVRFGRLSSVLTVDV